MAHNTAKFERHRLGGVERTLLVHRKGATRAFPPGHPELPAAYRETGQPVVIGGSMETGSYVLAGVATGARSFFSTAHGSGRTMSRHAARKRISGRELLRQMEARGVLVRAASLARPRRGGGLRLQGRRRRRRGQRAGRPLAPRGPPGAGGEREGMSFSFVEGATSDVTFEARAETLEALFSVAAEALLAATVSNPADVAPREREPLQLSEPDVELLLLRFLNELVFLRDARGLLLRAGALRIEHNGEARLAGELVGERIDPARHRLEADVKAATAHGLRVEPAGPGWQASVTLDV